MTISKPDEELVECGFGMCYPEDSLHCCHTAVTVREPAGPKNMMLLFWRCVFCGKESKTKTLVRINKWGMIV